MTLYQASYIIVKIISRPGGNTAKDEQTCKPIFLLVFSGLRATVSEILIHKNECMADLKRWTQHILLSHLCPPGDFLPYLVRFYPTSRILLPNSRNVRNTRSLQIPAFSRVNKFYPPESVPSKNYPTPKYLNSSDSCKFYLVIWLLLFKQRRM